MKHNRNAQPALLLGLRLLGSFQIRLDNQLLTSLSAAKARALLIYLVLTQQAHSRETLAGLLWPDMDEGRAKTNLRQALTKLRQALPDHLHITRQEIGIHPNANLDVDVLYFEEAILAGLAGERLRLEEAVELYKGDFLAGFYLDDADLFDEWMISTRERLRGSALQALELLVEQTMKLGQSAKALCYTRQLLALEPWREESHLQLMRLLVSEGRQSEALAQFEECQRILLEDLDVAPSTETVAFYEQIRSGRTMAGNSIAEKIWPAAQRLQDWGDAPELTLFYGREREMEQITQWIGAGARLITILAIGGTGKTALAAKVATSVAEGFDFVFWRSLLNAPPLDDWLRWCLQFLSRQQLGQLPTALDERLVILFDLLSQHRCLLIMDNAESILQPDAVGAYLPGYESYGQLIERIATTRHRSCLLLTSRERPILVDRFEKDNSQVQSLLLGGLALDSGQDLLTVRGVSGSTKAMLALVERYSGNPLALKLVADTIQEFFDGDITEFLTEEMSTFDDIRTVLEQQFARLTQTERDILIWLAIEREAVSFQTLADNLLHVGSKRALLEAIRAIQRRSLIEHATLDGRGQQPITGFTLQNVLIEFTTDYLTEHVYQEIQTDSLTAAELLNSHLNRFALLKVQAKEYVRQSQERLILQPIVERLTAPVGTRHRQTKLQERLKQILALLRRESPLSPGYISGNILNLLSHLSINISGYDFSQLCIWQANLRNIELTNLNFAGANLVNCAFTDTFGFIYAVEFSPDGQLFAIATGNCQIHLRQMKDGQPHNTLHGHSAIIQTIAFSPDGRFLASGGYDQTICLWEVETGRLLDTLHGHADWVWTVTFSPDGQWLASSGHDRTICLWQLDATYLDSIEREQLHLELPTGLSPKQPSYRLTGHTDWVLSLAFHPQGQFLASASMDRTVCLWDIAQLGKTNDVSIGSLPAKPLELKHEGGVHAVAFSPDGSILASADDELVISLWHADGSSRYHTLLGHTGTIRQLAFTSDSLLLVSGSEDQTMRVWDMATGKIRHTLLGHRNSVRSIAISPVDHTLLSGSADQTVRLWDASSGQALQTLQGFINAVWSVTYSHDGQYAASAHDDGGGRVWRVASINAGIGPQDQQAPHRFLKGHVGDVLTVQFSPTAEIIATGGVDHSVRLWSIDALQDGGGPLTLTAQQNSVLLQGHQDAVHSVTFSPDGAYLASAGAERTIFIWDVAQSPNPSRGLTVQRTTPLYRLEGHTEKVRSLCYSPDGTYLASASSDRTIILWACADIMNGYGYPDGIEKHFTLSGYSKEVRSIAFSADSKLLVSGGNDSTIQIWDVDNWQVSHLFSGHEGAATGVAVACSPCGDVFASGGGDQTVRIWDIHSGAICHVLRGHSLWVRSVAFSPDGKYLISGSADETIRIWDVERGTCLRILRVAGPYAGMNITNITGINEAQKASLRVLGAVEGPVLS